METLIKCVGEVSPHIFVFWQWFDFLFIVPTSRLTTGNGLIGTQLQRQWVGGLVCTSHGVKGVLV